MKGIILGSLLLAVSFTGMVSANADEVKTTEVQIDQQAPTQDAHVIDSWMQPAITRERTTTTNNGDTTKVVEPLVMERHERVVIPESSTTTTTTVTPAQQTVNDEVIKTESSSKVAVPAKKCVKRVSYRPRKHVVAHARPKTRSIAYRPATHTSQYVRRTVVEQPEVIQQTQHTENKATVIERRDPALDQN